MNTQNTTSQHTADLSFMSKVYDHGPDGIHGNPGNVIMSEHGEVCRVPFYMHQAGVTARIVHCVNSHDALVAALEAIEGNLHALLIERVLDSTRQEFYTVRNARDAARAALAQAKEGGK